MDFIIKGKTSYGKTRVEQESNLRKDGMAAMSEEHFEKAKYVEKKLGIKQGFIRAGELDKIGG